MSAKQYRKKIRIEAMQYNGNNHEEISRWVAQNKGNAFCSYMMLLTLPPSTRFEIHETLHGNYKIEPTDWIVKPYEMDDDYYLVVGSETFEENYEEVKKWLKNTK